MFMAIVRTLQKSYTATKNADSSGHFLHCSVLMPCPRVSLPINWPSAPDWLLQGLTPNWLTLFVLLFRSHRFSQAQLFVWSSRQSRQRVYFRHSSAASKMLEIRSPPWPPIHEPTQRYSHTHPYILLWISLSLPSGYIRDEMSWNWSVSWSCVGWLAVAKTPWNGFLINSNKLVNNDNKWPL